MIYKFIEEQRKKNHLSQEATAKYLKISRPTYIQIEKGKRSPTISEAEKLSDIFNISLSDLLKGRECKKTVINITKKKIEDAKETIRINIPQEKLDQFKQVLLYILKKVGGKPNVGMTVIYKLLYFIDFDYYEKYEKQLMGLVYLKNQHGPTPLLFERLIQNLIKDGYVEIIKSKFYQYPQIKYLVNPKTKIDLSVLNGDEKEHIDWELQRLSDFTATELSELSHRDVPWITAEDGKKIEYESVFYRTKDTSVRDYAEND